MNIKIRKDKKSGNYYVRVSDFKDIIDTKSIFKYEIDVSNTEIKLTFYDKKGSLLTPKMSGEIAYYCPKSKEIRVISYDCIKDIHHIESPTKAWTVKGSKSLIVKNTKDGGNLILGEI
jgi:hypothetical protein